MAEKQTPQQKLYAAARMFNNLSGLNKVGKKGIALQKKIEKLKKEIAAEEEKPINEPDKTGLTYEEKRILYFGMF